MADFLKALLIISISFLPFYGVSAEDASPSLEEVRLLIQSKTEKRDELESWLDSSTKAMRKDESERSILRLNLRKQDLNIKRLKISPEKESFETKNEIIGLEFEVKSLQKRIDEITASIEQTKKKQAEEKLNIGLLDNELEKLREQQDRIAALQVLEVEKTIEQPLQQQQQVLQQQQDQAQIEMDNAEFLEQERIRAAKRQALASQTRFLEPEPDTNEEPVAEEGATTATAAQAEPQEPEPAEPQVVDIELERARLIDEARTLRPAAAALNYAKARAMEPTNEPPLFGFQVDLKTSLPPGSKPKSLGLMRHLGNNQYMLEIPVEKGKQEFAIGKYRFFKLVPKQFDKALCMVLVDFRNKDKPDFQLLIID